MSRVAWPALMDLGLRRLGLRPAEFWDLTPGELMFLAGAEGGEPSVLTRGGLAELMEKYPDRVADKDDE